MALGIPVKFCTWNLRLPEDVVVFKSVISEHMLRVEYMIISCEIALIWMPRNAFDNTPTLVQVMVWAVRQQAITWENIGPDLCRYMASLGHNKLPWYTE